jgi:hypothetical protein
VCVCVCVLEGCGCECGCCRYKSQCFGPVSIDAIVLEIEQYTSTIIPASFNDEVLQESLVP